MNKNITGIILAGGKSRRMGKDKSLMLISGKRLIKIVIDVVSPLFEKLIIVTSNPNSYRKYGIRIKNDIVKDCGPLGGIYTGLVSSETMYNFVVACDMPFVNQDLIQYILKKSRGHDVTVAKYNGRPEPLCAVYSKNCIKPIEKQLSQNNLKITDFFKSVKVKMINEEEIARLNLIGSSFVNINTVEDYQRCR